MIELAHGAEPEELTKYRTTTQNPDWEDQAFKPIRQIVRRRLNKEQSGLCIYCEDKLESDNGHVEHIKAKSRNIDLTFTYQNLAHSCDGPRHCGHHKKRQVLPIEPIDGSNKLFSLSAIDGRFSATYDSTQQQKNDVDETVRILGLNNPALSWLRKGYVDTLLALKPEEVGDFLQTSPFRWSLERVDFV